MDPSIVKENTHDSVRTVLPVELDSIFRILNNRVGHDFSCYKKNTILRRIKKRMVALHLDQIQEYIHYLELENSEISLLFKELLIGVTGFFRNPGAFLILKHEIFPRLFHSLSLSCQLRLWVPGCSTGEEAYSLAIILRESLEKNGGLPDFKIFATDINQHAIDIARQGVYSASISEDIDGKRLERFFVKEGSCFRICKKIREMIIFAPHDLLKDPPFSRLDFICCRNLLIYLDDRAQKKVFPIFHHVLKNNGIIFLGASESINKYINHFSIINKKWKIFQKKTHSTLPNPEFYLISPGKDSPEKERNMKKKVNGEKDFHEFVEQMILHEYTPASLLVDHKFEILYFHNRTGKYFEPPVGEARWNALEMARDGLRLPLNIALREAAGNGYEVNRQGIKIKNDNNYIVVNLIVRPVNFSDSDKPLFLVIIIDITSPENLGKSSLLREGDNEYLNRIGELEKELDAAKEYLQSAFDDLETTNEELKSTNEELQSSNEELQSTNEELLTLNTDYENKIEELTHSNDDMANFLASTNIATMFLDCHLSIKRFTPKVKKIINLIDTDLGRPLTHIVSNLVEYNDFAKDCGEVLQTLKSKEIKVRSRDGLIYLMRILPYRTLKNVIDGFVITFIDITELSQIEKSLQNRLEFEQSIADISSEFINMPLDRIDAGVNAALEKIARFSRATRASLFILTPDRNIFCNTHEWCAQGENSCLESLQEVPFSRFGDCSIPLLNREIISVCSPVDHSSCAGELGGLFGKEEFRAYILIPLVYCDQFYGVLGFFGPPEEKVSWPEVFIHLLKFAGTILINTLERKKAEQSSQESEARWRSLTEKSPDFVTMVDLNLKIIYVNHNLYPNLAYEQLRGTPVYDYVPENCRDDIKRTLLGILETGQPALYETEYVNPDGSIIFYENHAVPREIDGRLSGLTLHTRDITSRKGMENNLLHALKDKEILINDIHHRVKNNLALLISLLSLEKNKLSNQEDIRIEYLNAFDNCISRINILSIIYTHLYQTTQNIQDIQCKEFILKLLNLIQSSYCRLKNIEFITSIDDVTLEAQKAIPLGLIINEAVSNSYKYAFPENTSGHISFTFRADNKKISLLIVDDGIGIQGNLDELKSKSLGLLLIDSLVQQLHGVIKMETKKGVSIKISFNR